SGLRIAGKSKPLPVVFGVNSCMMAPLGTYTAPKRRGGLAAALANGTNAGTMASRNGSAMAVPIPRRTVLRASDLPVTNIGQETFLSLSALRGLDGRRRRHPHAERLAVNHAGDECREAVVVGGAIANNPANRGHVPVIQSPAKRVGE